MLPFRTSRSEGRAPEMLLFFPTKTSELKNKSIDSQRRGRTGIRRIFPRYVSATPWVCSLLRAGLRLPPPFVTLQAHASAELGRCCVSNLEALPLFILYWENDCQIILEGMSGNCPFDCAANLPQMLCRGQNPH